MTEAASKPPPHMEVRTALVLRAPGVWTMEGTLPMLNAKVPIRMTVLAICKRPSPPPSPSKHTRPNRTELMVICPFDPTPELLAALQPYGTVKFILAPNTMHYLYASAFKAACPGAKLIAPAALVDKVPELPVDFVYPDLPHSLHSDVVQFFQVPLEDEVVVLHKPSKTLVVTDLAFNFESGGEVAPPGPPLSWYLHFAGGYAKCSLTCPFRWLINEPAALKAALDELMRQADFDTLIMAHGCVVLKGGKDALKAGTVAFVDKVASSSKASTSWSLSSLLLPSLAGLASCVQGLASKLALPEGLHFGTEDLSILAEAGGMSAGMAAGLVLLSAVATARYWVATK